MSRHRPNADGIDALDWRTQELLLLSQVMGQVGRSGSGAPAADAVLREMLHLMSELLGLNRGRVVLADEETLASAEGPARAPSSRIRHAYGLTREEVARGQYGPGEGVTGRVLGTGRSLDHSRDDAARNATARRGVPVTQWPCRSCWTAYSASSTSLRTPVLSRMRAR